MTNYAQWRSQIEFDAMMKDPEAQAHMREAAGFAASFESIYYDLRERHVAALVVWQSRLVLLAANTLPGGFGEPGVRR